MTLGVLFPGQGAQHIGMGADFVRDFDVAKAIFARADEVLGYELSELCFKGPAEELTLTRYCQPAIFVTSAAIVAVAEERGLLGRDQVAMCAGLSLGEYTALYYAGVFGFEDGLKLVAQRAEAMQDASDEPPSGMVSLLGANLEQAEALAKEAAGDEVLVVANLLSPGQIVLSGSLAACGRVPAMAKSMGIRRALPLKVAGAFHSPLMEPAAQRLADALDATEFQDAKIPVACNVTGTLCQEKDLLRSHLKAQIVKPVLWVDSMQAMTAAGMDTCFEPGPGRVLAGLMKKIGGDVSCRNVTSVEEL